MSEYLPDEKFRQKYNQFKCDIVETFDETTSAALLVALVEKPERAYKIMSHCRDDLAAKAATAFSDPHKRYWNATKIADGFKKVDQLIVTLNQLARIDSCHWSHLVSRVSDTNHLNNLVSAGEYLAPSVA